MKNYLLLTKIIMKNNEMNMPKEGSKGKAYKTLGTIALACIMLPCCFIVGFIVYIMTQALIEAGGGTEGLELIVQLMCVFGVIFSIMVIFNVLYFSTDLDHLLPLPIRPSELVAAKFTHAYFAESVMEFLILFCGLIGYFIAAGIKPVAGITAILGIFLLPVLPLVYCGIFCLIIMAFFSKAKLLKNVDFMVGLVSVLFVGLFVLSFVQMDSININNYIDNLMNGNNIFLKLMGKIFFTVPLFLKAVEENSILYCLLFVLVHVVCIAIMLLLGNLLYLKGVYLVSSGGRSGKKIKATSGENEICLKKRTANQSYFVKECLILCRTPAYRKYCVVVNLIWPILVIALFSMPATKNFMETFTRLFHRGYVASDMIVLLFVIILSFFATAMNSIASTSFTREGAHFSFLKYVPVRYKTQIQLKALVSILFSGGTVLISVILLCSFMKCTLASTIYFLVIAFLSVVMCTYIGIMLDATHPKLDWEDEYGALRGNLNAFFNMALAIVIAFVLCVIGYVLYVYTGFRTAVIFLIYLVWFLVADFTVIRTSIKQSLHCIKNDD